MSLPTGRDVRVGATWTGLGAVWSLLIVLIVAGITAILWALGVFSSGLRGAGDVHRDTNSAANRELWNATFNAEYQQIQTDASNLATLKSAATAPTATAQDRTNYEGAQLNCRQDVAKYNADASNVLASPWLPVGLPTIINPSNYCGS